MIYVNYAIPNEHKENIDNLMTISENSMKIYNTNMKLQMVYEGMNIRNCVEIHHRYLYSIDDALE